MEESPEQWRLPPFYIYWRSLIDYRDCLFRGTEFLEFKKKKIAFLRFAKMEENED